MQCLNAPQPSGVSTHMAMKALGGSKSISGITPLARPKVGGVDGWVGNFLRRRKNARLPVKHTQNNALLPALLLQVVLCPAAVFFELRKALWSLEAEREFRGLQEGAPAEFDAELTEDIL